MSRPIISMTIGVIAGLYVVGCGADTSAPTPATEADNTRVAWSDNHLERAIEDEVIYFVMPDRFENGDTGNDRGGSVSDDRLIHGYDPTDYGFYHGGDLKGLTDRLDYIQGLGATAIWLTPIFENNWVQGPPSDPSASYHGYWITDFTNVDPHLGTRADFKAFVDAAHGRGMKVYMDIITNHSADIIQYRECHDPDWSGERVTGKCAYRYIGDYPWTTRGTVDGDAINPGFQGDESEVLTVENFAYLTDPSWAYTPFVPDGLKTAKTPAWLNDPIYYHNRGDSDFRDEDSVYGDFSGLDDLNTEHPRVVDGMIEIYRSWITEYGVDGFRIDTAKHVRPEFWQRFVPAILDQAEVSGIEHFHIFGEVYEFDPAHLAKFTLQSGLPSTLDFAFQTNARDLIAGGGSGLDFTRLLEADEIYKHGQATARQLPTFLGNHDMGRFSQFLREENPDLSDAEMFDRLRLANALMFFTRGVPTIYYGDEQGFVSDTGDKAAREDMFPSQTARYNDNDLVASDLTTASNNFDTSHPLYLAIAEFAQIRKSEPALRYGDTRIRYGARERSIIVFSRYLARDGGEIVVAINAEDVAVQLNIAVRGASTRFVALLGACNEGTRAVGSYTLTIPARDIVVCKSIARDV